MLNIHQNKLTLPPKIIIYSEAGIGKTTFASKAAKPVFLCTEDGLGSLPVDCSEILKDFRSIEAYLTALETEEHDYKTLVIDSLDHLEPLIHKHVCEMFKVRSIEALGYGRGYVEALLVWQYLFSMIDSVRAAKNMAIVLICHAEIKKFDDPTSESYDRYQLKLHRKAAAYAIESVDCLLFATYRNIISKQKTERVRAVSAGERVIYTEARPYFQAKNRYNLPFELPLDFKLLMENVKKC